MLSEWSAIGATSSPATRSSFSALMCASSSAGSSSANASCRYRPCSRALRCAPRAMSTNSELLRSIVTSPIVLLRPCARALASLLREKPSASIASSTRSRLSSLTIAGRFSTFETVPVETPARLATSSDARTARPVGIRTTRRIGHGRVLLHARCAVQPLGSSPISAGSSRYVDGHPRIPAAPRARPSPRSLRAVNRGAVKRSTLTGVGIDRTRVRP